LGVMLSLCAPFSGTHRHIESLTGLPVAVTFLGSTPAGETVSVQLTGQDEQLCHGPFGPAFRIHGRNVGEIFKAVTENYPGIRFVDLTVVVQCGEQELRKTIDACPLNLELFSTIVRRLLRQINGR